MSLVLSLNDTVKLIDLKFHSRTRESQVYNLESKRRRRLLTKQGMKARPQRGMSPASASLFGIAFEMQGSFSFQNCLNFHFCLVWALRFTQMLKREIMFTLNSRKFWSRISIWTKNTYVFHSLIKSFFCFFFCRFLNDPVCLPRLSPPQHTKRGRRTQRPDRQELCWRAFLKSAL